MNATRTKPRRKHRWIIEELAKLPTAECDVILSAAAKKAAPLYRIDRELTAFEAFGEEDLYGDSAGSAPR